jgi:hypothetical protein
LEAEYPDSKLPAAAHMNTCESFSYDYLGQFGFLWRGVADGDVDIAGEAADAELAAGETGTPTTNSTNQVTQALFGKIWRKAVGGHRDPREVGHGRWLM